MLRTSEPRRVGAGGKLGCTVLAAAIAISSAAHAQSNRPGDAAQADSPQQSAPAPQAAQAEPVLQQVTVTAERVALPQNKVPISLSAMSTATLNQRGVEDITQLAAQVPGVTFSKTNNGGNDISIRGISSTVGAQTTGIYINDTPIQVRNAGYTSSNVYPVIFDLARVEVLRGPQGTLFGAGSEGGAIRFITNQPSFSRYSAFGRTEVSTTQNGSPSQEVGLAVGGPLVDDKLAFRVSGYLRNDGGWIDRVNPITGQLEDAAANRSNTDAEDYSLAYRPTSRLTITASLFHQYIHTNDLTTQWWESFSDPSREYYAAGNLLPSPGYDRLYLPALDLTYDFDSVTLVSNTSYMYRHDNGYTDYTDFLNFLLTGNPYATSVDRWSKENILDYQRFFTQEVRLQSANPNARLRWVAGVFYQLNRQYDEEAVPMPSLPEVFFAAHGTSYIDYYGSPLGPDNSVYTDIEKVHDRQVAGFGQIDYRVLPKLTVTAGVRVAKFNYDFNSQNFGPFAGTGTNAGTHSESVVSPKYGLAYQINNNDMVYATASKGFRPGGAERVAPSPCDSDLASLGISKAPTNYDSDSVWSYEVGTKDTFAGRLSITPSVFYIKWSNIQHSVDLPVCGQNTILNLGTATSKGFDMSTQARISRGLQVYLDIGYTDATADQTITTPGAKNPLIVKGQSIGGDLFSPWQLAAGGQYDRNILGVDAFIRADYQFRGEGPPHEPQLIGYDPTLPRTPSDSLLSLRLGATLSEWELSLFVNNVLDSHVDLERAREYFTPLYFGISDRPRTIGLRAIYRSE